MAAFNGLSQIEIFILQYAIHVKECIFLLFNNFLMSYE